MFGIINANKIVIGIQIAVHVMHAGSPSPKATSMPINNSASSPICFFIYALAAFPIGVSPSIIIDTILGIKIRTLAIPIPIPKTVVGACLVSSPKKMPTINPTKAGSPKNPNFSSSFWSNF